MKFQYFPNLDHLTVGCWEFFYWKMSFSRPVIVLISSLDMNISTLTYLPTIHILTSKINFWKSEFWDHLAKPLGCPLHYCCEAVLKPKKSTKCFTGKNDFMDLCRSPYHQYWNETRCPFEDSSWYAQPIQPNLADISACVPPALKKGIMFYFNFGEFGFYKGP